MSRPIVVKPCKACGTEFSGGRGGRKYCDACDPIHLTCAFCEAPFTERRAYHEFRPRRYCSIKCASTENFTPIPQPKGKAIYFDRYYGRWQVYCRDGSSMPYYRAVMAGHIGRLLRSDEHVHHINEDPTDDRIENLQIVTRSEHTRLHRLWEKAQAAA